MDAHEEHGRQAVAGEGDRDVHLLGVGGELRRHHRDEHRCGEDADGGDGGQEDHDEGQEAVGVRLASVVVLLHGPHELRDEDGVERAAADQHVDHRRQGVGDLVRVVERADADGTGDDEGPQEAGDAGDDRAGGHEGAGLEQAGGSAGGLARCRGGDGGVLGGGAGSPLLVPVEVREGVGLGLLVRRLGDQGVHSDELGGRGVVAVGQVPGGPVRLGRRSLGPDVRVRGVHGGLGRRVERPGLLVGAGRRRRVGGPVVQDLGDGILGRQVLRPVGVVVVGVLDIWVAVRRGRRHGNLPGHRGARGSALGGRGPTSALRAVTVVRRVHRNPTSSSPGRPATASLNGPLSHPCRTARCFAVRCPGSRHSAACSPRRPPGPRRACGWRTS